MDNTNPKRQELLDSIALFCESLSDDKLKYLAETIKKYDERVSVIEPEEGIKIIFDETGLQD